jgi:hypothetical protein
MALRLLTTPHIAPMAEEGLFGPSPGYCGLLAAANSRCLTCGSVCAVRTT